MPHTDRDMVVDVVRYEVGRGPVFGLTTSALRGSSMPTMQRQTKSDVNEFFIFPVKVTVEVKIAAMIVDVRCGCIS